MIDRRPFDSLGGANHGWLDAQAPFLVRRAITTPSAWAGARCACGTTTRSQPQTGFPTHPHADMEIITYVREGAITHKDSLGNTGPHRRRATCR